MKEKNNVKDTLNGPSTKDAIFRSIVISLFITILAGGLMALQFGIQSGLKLSLIVFPVGVVLAFIIGRHQD